MLWTLLIAEQTSSSVYENDLSVSRSLKAYENIASAYREHGDRLRKEDRLNPAVFKECLNVDWWRYPVTDEEVDGIAARWRKSKLLRELYLDEGVAQEFVDFRNDFVSSSAAEDRFPIIKPGVALSRRTSSGHLQSQPRGLDFKERFHHALCMNTIAVASHQLAKACSENLTVEHGELVDANPDWDVYQAVTDYWTRSRWYLRGIAGDLDFDMKADNLEVFDFLYIFLLQKVLPFEKFAAWTQADAVHWSEEGGFEVDEEDDAPYDIQKWHTFLSDCRKSFQPLDLVDLIKGKAWAADAAYPPDKSMYLRVRGVFDGGESESVDWCSFYERAPIVYPLCPMKGGLFNLENTERPCWWDRVRLKCGSPFVEGFEDKFDVEVGKMLELEKQEGAKKSGIT